MMLSFRSVLSLILVLVTTLLVSCSGAPTAKIPTTYSPEKIEQLQVFIAPIEESRERMSVLADFIAERNWIDTGTYIHGPLGQLRQEMTNLTRNLLPKDQKQANRLAKEVFGHFERIDAAAKDRDATSAEVQYREALKDFNAFVDLIPTAS